MLLGLGCLDPMVDDAPGYSRYVLPEGTEVAAAADEYEVDHKIDQNDNVDPGVVALSDGFADGMPVRYWDLGVVKASIGPAYVFSRCDADGLPIADERVQHPLLWDSLPGDPDFSPFRSLNVVCLTDRYAGEVISSLEALSDAIDLGIVLEPGEPQLWANYPVVSAGVELGRDPEDAWLPSEAYARGRRVTYFALDAHEGNFAFMGKRISAPNVYELSFAGQEQPSRVVFAHALSDATGARDPGYSPVVKVITVTLAADADVTLFTRESELVSIGEGGALTPVDPAVLSAKASGDSVNRPQWSAGGGA